MDVRPGKNMNMEKSPSKTTGVQMNARVTMAPDARVEPRIDPGKTEPPKPAKRSWLPAVAAIVLVAAIAAGAAYQFAGPGAPHVGITTTTGVGEPFGGTVFLASDDQVTDKQWKERAEAFQKFKAAGPVQLDRAPRGDADGYIGKTISDPQARAALAADVDKGATDMVAIGFFDDCAEDGDVVTVSSGPVKVMVPLTHTVQYVLVPVPKGQSATVDIGGVQDGTGGITLGMVTPVGTVHMPAMLPGQHTSFQAR
jgi:hypothetical protein